MTLSSAIKAYFQKKKERRASTTASIATNRQTQHQRTDTSSKSSATLNSSSAKGDSKDGLNFTFQDGRRYHNEAEVSYVLPNDYDGIYM